MPDYLNKNGFTYTAQELEEYAQQENMSFDDYLKSKSFTEVDTQVDPKINPETGEEFTFMEKLSNIFEPNIPSIKNLGEQFAQTGMIAIDKMFETMLPKGGRVSNFIEKVGQKYGGVPKDVEFDAGTLIDQMLYVTGDYDKKPGEAFGKIKLPSTMTEEEKENLRKAGAGELDVLGKVIKHEQDIIDKRLEGKGGYTGEGFFSSSAEDKVLAGINALNGVVMTVAPAMLTGGRSLGPQIALPMISNYNKEKAKFLYGEDDPDALRKLGRDNGFELATPAVLGYIAYGLEKLQFKGITEYMTKQAFKPGRFVKLFQTGVTNGTQEAFQGLTESLNMRLAKGETRTEALGNTFSDDLFSEEFFENFMLGVVGGTGVASGGSVITRALKADEQTSVKLSGFVDDLSDLRQLRAQTTSEVTLKKIDKKIQQTEEAFADYINQNNDLQDYLTENQENDLRSILQSKDKNKKDLENLYKDLRSGKITKQEFDLAFNEITIEQAENDASIVKIKTEANMALLKADLDKQGEFVGDITGLEIEDYDNQDQFFEALEKEYKKIGKKMPNYKDSNIRINGIKVGNKFLVNNTVAAETNATGVGIHEIIHGVVKSTLQEDDGTGSLSVKGEKLVKSFISKLSAKELRLIEAELEGGDYKKNKDGTEKDFKEYGEEYVTIYTQLLKEGRFSKNGLQKFGSWFSNILNKETPFKKISFEDGDAIKSFLDAFVKGDVTALEQAKELAREGVKMKQTVEESRSTVNLDKGEGDISQKIDALTKGAKTKAEFQKPGGAFDNIYSGMLEGRFDKIFGKGISLEQKEIQRQNLADRLMNYDPAKTPELSKWIYGGSGKAGNVVYSGLVAKKKLFEEGEKRKRTTRLDDPDVKDMPDDTPAPDDTPTETIDQKQPKKRKLKDFNVELSNPEFISALTATTVNNLLNDLNTGKITFQQAVVRMDDLVLKDIRSELSKLIPKIAKNPETGKREPTPEYESFIRNEYLEVVQSLGIKTIRTSYKKWFKQEKTGKKDYKNIDPVTGDVSNFVKDTQINTTNKREYIRWFLEGKPGDLTERRTALIRRISKRKTSLAVDSYIEENSNNLSDKMKAKMRTMSDSAQNAIDEQASFDYVKFSKSLKKNDDRINKAMEKNGFYKAPNGTILTFAKRKDGTWDKGRVFEQAMNETLQEIVQNIKGISIESEVATEEGGRADLIIEYTDGAELKVENHEIKKSLSAFMGSTLISELDLETGNFALANEIHNDIKGLNNFVEKIVKNLKKKVEVINKEIDIYNKKYGYKKGDVEFAEQITGNVVKRKPESMPLEVYDKVGKELGVLKAGVEVIANHYKGKTIKVDGKKIDSPVKSISLFGYGSFRIDNSSIFKGLPMLDVATEVYASIRYGKRETKGSKDFVTFKPGLQFRLDGKPKNESNSGLYTEQAVMQALNAPAFSKNVGKAKVLDNAIKASRTIKDPKGITILDFDDTLATTQSLVKYTRPDGTTGTLNAEEYASTYEDLLDQGYIFDFSDFNKVVKGKVAPLFQKALKLQGKFGSENMFVLTARPPAAAKPIFDFLKANGLNIPLKNITGLANSTSEAKALWIADKVGEGYNDFYFADDALQNVQAVDNVLSQFDVKRKIQQAKVKFSKGTLSTKQDLNWKTDSIGYMTTNFNIDGNNYKITFYPTDLNDTNYELEFDLVTEKGLTQEMTGTGNQFKVLGVVYNGLLDVIKQNPNIETIGFSSLTKDKSRARVYTILMDRLGKKLGWKTDIYEYGSGTQLDFEVVKPKTRKARTKTTESIRNIPAVKNILNQADIKSPTQQAKVKFSKSMDSDFNKILEDVTNIDAVKRFSAVKARKRGESKGKFRFFIPPSHEDFVGLLYNFMGKGKEGNKHRDFFEQALIRPLNRAFRELNTARQSIANDYKSLNKQFKDVKKKLNKKTPDGDFTYQDAIRVYLWDKHGHNIPGLTPTDQQNLVDLVMGDAELRTYAESLNIISKRNDYVKPSEGWEITDIRMDLDDATGRIGRSEFFTEFLENAGIIFSPENLNKIEAAYGPDMVSAIKDMLYRIETGRNRPSGQNKIVNGFMNWFNASVASTMFINVRSVVLQQMSLVNFINYSDNNILAVAKAFANQKQYWTDWAFLFNSDFMKQRRGGIKTDVNGAELVDSLKGAKNSPITLLNKLLQLGFKPTQIGDNIAIATGGAPYYRNRINTYLKQGLSQKEAEAKAFVDFQVLAEATQQSARPDMVSQQQASPLGKIILAFQNVTSQFNRLGKKAFLDIKNRRISPEYRNASNPQLQSDISNLSRIAYYFAIQNLVFATLQSALFMALFDDDEEDKQLLRKKERAIHQSIDSVLRGTGVWGAAIATLKNMAIKRFENQGKDWRANEYSVLAEALQVSPPLGARARKLVKAERELIWDKDIIKDMKTFDIENPVWSATTNYIEGTTNAPLNRTYNLTLQAKDGLDNQFSAYQRALRLGGWGRWDVGIEDVGKEKTKQKFSNKKKTKSKSFKDFKFK